MVECLIREYREQDLAELMAAWEAASAIAQPFLPPEFVAGVREDIPRLYLPNAETWVADHEGSVVGFISLLGNEVGALFVAPDHQGKGFGRGLMDKARQLKGTLEVEVFLANSIGREFYRKYGFVQMSEARHEETGFDLVRMRLPDTEEMERGG
jgi:putative acetyltransferase